ncbi:type II toxin-antitoxin system VapC family toxin [uncultured Rhodoblastus sp.]|uniref:type II toxin-antitoxin system VapC family toxin n=1 Tax=uncultured Rhodoblastus sp. TaxID=543037 RepID=UPI0025D123E3|nr:type II toxin-antitoxin system VapC family toxin [uncultured Rhodoblastus sp.]
MTEAQTGALAYLDANVFIDFVEGKPELAEKARDLFLGLGGATGVFTTSELTLAEVLSPSRTSPGQRRLYMSLIIWNPALALIPISRDILIETAELRKYSGHKLPDAIHVVTALRQKCRFMISRDKDMDKLPTGALSRLEPGPTTVAALIEAFRGN